MSSSDFSHEYVTPAPSAVVAAAVYTAAVGAVTDWLVGWVLIVTVLYTVNVAALVVVVVAAVFESQTHRYCHPLYE